MSFNVIPAIRNVGGLPVTAGLVNHLDASLESGVTFVGATGDGQDAALWLDQSGNGQDWSEPGGFSGNPPSWHSNVQNGLGACRCIGSSNERFINFSPPLSGTQEAEIWMVMKSAVAMNNFNGLWRMGNVEATSGGNVRYPESTNLIKIGWGSTTSKTGIAQSPGSVILGWHVLNIVSQAGNWQMWANDISQHLTGTNTVGWTGGWSIGLSFSTWATCDYGEMAIFSTVMNAGQRAAMRNHFNSKWALGF